MEYQRDGFSNVFASGIDWPGPGCILMNCWPTQSTPECWDLMDLFTRSGQGLANGVHELILIQPDGYFPFSHGRVNYILRQVDCDWFTTTIPLA